MSLKTLSIYECDLSLLKMIAETQAQSLERLTIAAWHQPGTKPNQTKEENISLNTEDLKGIQMCLGGVREDLTLPAVNKFTKLEMLSFCATWFDFKVEREVIDE